MNRSKSGIWPLLIVFLAATVLAGLSACGPKTVDPEPYRHESPSEYYLYIPEGVEDGPGTPVFVGIHGHGGNGRSCWSDWQPYADKEGFVLLCPSLADAKGGWYQNEGEEKVRKILNEVLKDHKFNRKLYFAGFSAGAQFVQGFANNYPNITAGVAILSAGNYYRPTNNAKPIAFLVVIGDRDDPVALQGADAYKSLLEASKFKLEYVLLKGVGHTLTRQTRDLTIEHFKSLLKK